MEYFEESGRITKEMYEKITTSFQNRALIPSGQMKKRPGLNLPVITASTPVIKHWRTTKNGKSRLYLIK